MPRIESPKEYKWDGKQSRYWYKTGWTVFYTFDGGGQTDPKYVESTLGTVTRVSNTRSPYFNHWFAVLHGPPEIKSEPMLSRDNAMRWLEVIERMNR